MTQISSPVEPGMFARRNRMSGILGPVSTDTTHTNAYDDKQLSAPARHEMFFVRRNKFAWLNGKKDIGHERSSTITTISTYV